MSTCPRCGTSLAPTATVCTACCYLFDDAGHAPVPAVTEVAAPETAVPEATAPVLAEARPPMVRVPDAATAGLGNGLRLPTQRGAAFNPLRISSTPPPNTYLAAERRQRAGLRAAAAKRGVTDPLRVDIPLGLDGPGEGVERTRAK